MTPGVDRAVASRHGIRYLRGTADAIQNDEHMRLNQVAYRYAERYNKILQQRFRRSMRKKDRAMPTIILLLAVQACVTGYALASPAIQR